jgi:hypothetical protein
MPTSNGQKADQQKKATVVCPYCHCEYHPTEVFMPGEILGKPSSVIKDALGKIIYEEYKEGDEPTLVEHFTCESCGKPFVVEATLTVKTKPEDEELDFTTPYSSILGD